MDSRTQPVVAILRYLQKRHELVISCNRNEPVSSMPHYIGSKPVLQAACKRVFPLNSFSRKGKQSSAYEAFRQFQARQAPVLGPWAEISKSKFIIVICTRWSSGTATELRGPRVQASLLHRHIEELLSRQELLKGAGRTKFFSSYRIAPLKSALPTDKWDSRRNPSFSCRIATQGKDKASNTCINRH